MTDEATEVVTLKGWVLAAKHPAIKKNQYRLFGVCWSHPRFRDGSSIRTSRILDVSGRYILTHSGTLYYLDDPIPEYIEFLHKHGYIYDPENPIILE